NQVEENEEEEVVAPRFEIRIKDADARTCALAAYLADAGAASFSQALKAANLPRFMADVNSLITTGALSRNVAGFENAVEFAVDGRSSPLLAKTSVSSNGSITDGWGAFVTKPLSIVGLNVENDKLWQMHGIIAACKAMDIVNVETATKEALESLGFKVSSLRDKDSKRRYEAVPQDIIYAMADDDEVKAKQGCIAFTSTYDNTFHCALQNAYEEMRTLRARSSHLARVHSAVREVLFDKFVSKDLHEQVALRAVFAEFLDTLQSDLEEIKVTDAKSFKDLVIKALPEIEEGKVEPAQVTAVKALVQTDAFTEAVGQKFDANHFPWNVVPVGTASDFVRVYDDSKVLPFEPKSALGLFGILVNKLKTVQAGNVVYLTSPQHALEFIGNPKAFEDTPKASWDASIKQAKAIMEQEVKKVEVRTSCIKAMGELIGDFYRDIPKKIGQKPTFEEFRSKLLPNELAAILEDVSTEPYHAELDNLITNFLYEKQKDLFVPFARTTTPVDGQVIEFCFFADPITSTVAIAMIRDNKVTRVDQTEWLEGNWHFGQIQAPVTV
ncbi:MAG: hypothetical protein LLF94_02325, partial [Chlamydiales bacterium]|nr:hypothetical protein [Chlamydiales bacterium]